MENASEEDFQPIEEDRNSKPVRHRKKMFYRTLRHQMEFYFSDANISKNRFMGQRLLQDPQVELSLFLTFNKIRAMTNNVNDIAKALRKSKMLSITEDGLKIFRTTEICKRKEEDDCTIYVEHLPPDAEHEWLRSIFLPYGEVPYVSIPKFHISKMNKGFAFVEFDSPETANRALKAFEEMGCRLSSQIPPEEIGSNLVQEEKANNDNDNDPDKNLFKKPNAKIDIFQDYSKVNKSVEIAKEEEMEPETNLKGKKRKFDSEVIDVSEVGEKKAKSDKSVDQDPAAEATEVVIERDAEENVEVREYDAGNKEEVEEVQDYDEKENDGEDEEEEGKRRKSRKHKKKKNKRLDHVDPKLALRVLSKVEWKILRNKYVALQKSKMKALKHQLARSRWVENYSHEPKEQNRRDKTQPGQGEPPKITEKTPKEFTFVPGVIVRVGFKEPAIDVKAFKAAARTHKDVVYVDVSEGATEAFIRCANADVAGRLIKGQPWTDMSLIDGSTEQEYWEKITRDRDQKVKGNVANLVKRRGRDKLLKKAEKALGKHIRFDEPE